MGRSRRRTTREPPAEPPAEPTSHAEKMEHHPFAAALRGVKAAAPPKAAPLPVRPPPAPRPAPRPEAPSEGVGGYGYDDRMAFREAFAGVRPLGEAAGGPRKRKPKAPPARVEPPKRAEADEEVRARLDALVSGGIRFEVERDADGAVRGRREGAHASHLASLGEGFVPQATLDLHGMRAEVAARAIVSFVRESKRLGKRSVLIIHGRGNGSALGVSVLRDVAVDALTGSGASSSVLAFASAPRVLGGVGALAVRLGER